MGLQWASRATPQSKGGGLMPALSFQEEWINKLLRGDKQQTTRPQTDRIKVGDIVSMYNQQRRRITDKPLLLLTATGLKMFREGYPFVKTDRYEEGHHAHFLGKVEITEVYDIKPSVLAGAELEAWARLDGFDNFASARCWFEIRNGARWMQQMWTVIRWNGWQERYFKPEE